MKFGNYEIDTVVVPTMGTNCYFIKLDNKAILVDAAGEGNLLYNHINKNGIELEAILITHGHFDHIEALDLLCEKYPNLKVYAFEGERVVIGNSDYSLMNHMLKEKTNSTICYIKDGTTLNLLDLEIKLINTPGHTIGSSCYYIKELNVLFSGDTLFRGTYGRTDLPTSDVKSMVNSVAIELMKFNDDLLVLPGHGFRTNIGFERKNNELVRDYAIKWSKS